MQDELAKTSDSINKPIFFYWTVDLIAEVSREIYEQRRSSDIWSGDYQAEKMIIKEFVKQKKFEEKHKDLVISDAGQTLIVDKVKFEELTKFLYNYNDEGVL